MESKHVLHAVVAAPLGAIAGGGLGFGMTGEWTPLISGLVAALTSSTYLAVIHLLPKWRKRRGVADSVDARPAPFHFNDIESDCERQATAMEQADPPA